MALGDSVLWFGRKKKTSFGNVRLKHRELFFGGRAERKSLKTVEKAYAAVRGTIALMNSDGTPARNLVQEKMQLYFKCDRKLKVMGVLELIQNGMKNGFSLKTDNTSVQRSINVFGDEEDEVDLTEGYVTDYGHRQGDIHVTRDYIMNNRFQAVRTLIHEASHKFAQTDDFDEQGYIFADGSDFREPGITAEQCLNNADSYAYFCMAVGYR